MTKSLVTPVILFSNATAAYGVVRALGPLQIPIFCVSAKSSGLCKWSRFVRKHTEIHPQDPNFLETLISWGLASVGAEAVLIVAGSDEYLDVLARGKKDLPAGWQPTFPDYETVQKVREKHLTYEIAASVGVPIPKSYYIKTRQDLERLCQQGIAARWPMLFKPEKSNSFYNQFNQKAVICESTASLLPSYDQYRGFGGPVILQEMIPGPENNLQNFIGVFNHNSEPLAIFVNRKRRSSDRFLGCSLMETMWSEEVIHLSNVLIKAIGYIGYANVEFKLDPRDNSLRLMEINGRVSKSNSHALPCGINLPLAMYQMAIGKPTNPMTAFPRNYPDNIIWWCPASDVSAIFRMVKNHEFKLIDFLKSLRGDKRIVEPFNLRDPGPAFNMLISLFNQIIRRIFRL